MRKWSAGPLDEEREVSEEGSIGKMRLKLSGKVLWMWVGCEGWEGWVYVMQGVGGGKGKFVSFNDACRAH